MELLISFTELLIMIFIYNILVGKRIFNKILYSLVIAGMSAVVYNIVVLKLETFSILGFLVAVFIMGIFFGKIEEKEIIITIIEFIVSVLVLVIVEIITGALLQVVSKNMQASDLTFFICLIVSSIVTFVILRKWISKNSFDFDKTISNYKALNLLSLNLVVYCLLAKIFLGNGDVKARSVVVLAILGVILITINVSFYFYVYRALNAKKKTEIKKSFDPLISELMSKLKNNENEYKMHLNNIYNFTQMEEESEAISKIKKYIESSVSDNEDFAKLLVIENTIVKAVLYNKLQRADKLRVNYDFSITSDLKSIPVDDSELTVILSNIINNAIEANNTVRDKDMFIDIYESDKKYYIKVKNKVADMKLSDVKQIFKYGYSTKGEGRGYGLYTVKNIVEKYRGKIHTTLKDNTFILEIVFTKTSL